MVLLAIGLGQRADSSSVVHLTLQQHLEQSCAVMRGTVLALESFRDGHDGQIYTRAKVQVEEAFKGRFPEIVAVIHRGGVVGEEAEMDGFAPRFEVGEEGLFFFSRRTDGTLFATLGGPSAVKLERMAGSLDFSPRHQTLLEKVRAQGQQSGWAGDDVTDQSAEPGVESQSQTAGGSPAAVGGVMGLIVDGLGISARFTQPDRGEPIPYLVDADALPAGVTLTQALQAVEAALAAWTAVTSLKYTFEGVQSFGMPAANVPISDGRLRIQLHDNYGYITGANTLGVGSRVNSTSLVSPAGWATGGNVAGNEFHQSLRASVVLKHTKPALQNLTTLTEVLTHEIGHTLSLAHSSEDPGEPDPVLRESIMFALAHADGRGATLGSYDVPVVRQVHPPANTPPYTYGRVMDVVTDSPSPPNVAGINEVELRGYDLQSTILTLATNNATLSSGTFSRLGNIIKFTPNYVSGARLDPATGSYYARIAARFSDGTNASPFVYVSVISLSPDTSPSPTGDGLPDNWMTTYFGNANPAAGPNRGANDDFDGDGLSNKQEFLLGSNPTNANSRLQITAVGPGAVQWEAKAYEVYEVECSSNLSTWTRPVNPIVPTSSAGSAFGLSGGAVNREFFRVLKVP